MRQFHARSLALIAVATTVLSACGGGSGDTTAPPQTVRTLGSISVTAPSLSVAAGNSATIGTNAFDTSNAALSGVTFTYASSNTSVLEVEDDGSLLAIGAGTSTVTVTGALGAVTKTATVAVTVTGSLPANASVVGGTSTFTFTPATVLIARGGSVGFTWGTTAHTATFDAVSGAPASIAGAANVNDTRAFNTAGNFPYHCTIHSGMTGMVVVR
jgi:plastocyanin